VRRKKRPIKREFAARLVRYLGHVRTLTGSRAINVLASLLFCSFLVFTAVYYIGCEESTTGGCSSTPSFTCTDFPLTISPGQCINIDNQIDAACRGANWNAASSTSSFSVLDHNNEFYPAIDNNSHQISGQQIAGQQFCANQGISSYSGEHVGYEVTSSADPFTGSSGCNESSQANILVTTDFSKICNNELCISASANPSSIVSGAPVDLDVNVTSGVAPYTYMWTAQPPGGGITPGDEFNQTLTVYPTVTTDYTVEVMDFSGNQISDTVTVTVTGRPVTDLVVTKSDDPDPVIINNTLTYTIDVINNGPDDAVDVQVTDLLPQLPSGAFVTFVSAAASRGQGCTEAGGMVDCPLGTMAARDTAAVTIEVIPTEATVPAPSPPPTMSNQVSVTTPAIMAGNALDPVPNNLFIEHTKVLPPTGADLAISQSDNPDRVVVDTLLTYTIQVTNNGPENAPDVMMKDHLPVMPSGQQVPFVSAVSTQGSCVDNTAATGTVDCDLHTVAAGSTVTITIEVKPSEATVPAVTPPNTISNVVNVLIQAGSPVDPDLSNNDAVETTVVLPPTGYDLDIAKTGSPEPVVVHNILTYTIQVTNHGPDDAPDVTVSDMLPSLPTVGQVTFLSASASQGQGCTNNGGLVECTFNQLIAGDTATITLSVIPTEDTTGYPQLSNVADVSTLEMRTGNPDPDTSNNMSAPARTTVLSTSGANTPPVAADDTFTMDEDSGTLSKDVVGNDTDAEGDPLTVMLGSDVSRGTLTLNPDGSFDYTPDPNFFGTDFFTYIAYDGQFYSNVATATILVNRINDPPVAVAAGPAQPVNVGDTVQLDGSGSYDVDKDPLTYSWSFFSIPAGSSAVLMNPAAPNPTFVPDVAGIYEVQLVVNDGQVDSAPDIVSVSVNAPSTTTLGDGTDPPGVTVEPGAADQFIDEFTFETGSSGGATVDALTLTTTDTAAIASMEIWDSTFSIQYFTAVNAPVNDDWSFSGGVPIPVTASQGSYRVRVTFKGHAALASGSYAVTANVTAFTTTDTSSAGSDSAGTTVTVDNLAPADAVWGAITPESDQIILDWTNPADTDFAEVVILRNTLSITDAPDDGTTYTAGGMIGTSDIVYVGALETFTDTGVVNGTGYFYKIFSRDLRNNYSAGSETGPHTPVLPVLSIDDVSAAEGNAVVFTVNLSQAVPQDVTVNFDTVAGGTATANVDYTSVSGGTLTFPPNDNTPQTITVQVAQDTIVELDETFFVDLSNASNATIAKTRGVGTIQNDDTATLTINDVTLDEGNTGTTPATQFTFTVTLDNAVDAGFTVDVDTADDTATTADNDYAAITGGTLNFSGTANETQTITVDVAGDTLVELDETFFVNLSNIQAGNRSVVFFNNDSQGQGAIQNDDAATLMINDVSMFEGNAGTTAFQFTVTLDNAVDRGFTVRFDTASGGPTPATAGSDYIPVANGVLNFNGTANEVQTLTIDIVGDTVAEPDETFLVNLSNIQAGNRNVTFFNNDSQGLGTIRTDDAPVLSIDDVSAAEGNAVVFTVNLSQAVPQDVTVNFDTVAGGTATANVDYTSVSGGTLTFPPNDNTPQTITVQVAQDAIVELDETFFVDLSNASNATIAKTRGVGTIQNDDTATLTINDVTLDEGNTGTTPATQFTFTVTLDNAVDAGFTVGFDTSSTGGTATANVDYTPVTNGILNFSGTANETQTITVDVAGDTLVELDETFFVDLSNIQAGGRDVTFFNNDSQGQGTIQNDDAATLMINDVTMFEGNAGTTAFTFTVTLDNAVETLFTVRFDTADDTAIATNDYIPVANGVLNFNGTAGETQTITVDVIGDTVAEPDETFFVDLSNIQAGGRDVTFFNNDSQGLGTIENEDICPLNAVRWVPVSDGVWHDGANWSTGSVPGPGDDVCIDVGGGITVTHSQDSVSGVPDAVNSIVSNENINLSGGTLSVANTSSFLRDFALSGGTFTGTGSLTVTGLLTWSGSGGQMNGSGITTANGGMNIGGQIRLGRRLDLPAGQTASWTAGNIYLQDDGTDVGVFNNFGTFRAEHAGNQVIALWIGNLTKTFNNAGQFIKAMPASITTVQNNTIAFINGGSVDVQAGTLRFINETLSGNGTYDVGSGATLDFGITTALDGTITGLGTVVFSSGTIDITGILNIQGSYQQTSARLGIVLYGSGGVAGVDFDQLNVTGNAALGGILDVSLDTGFTPSVGDSFVVMTYGSQSGAYTSIFTPSGFNWNVSVGLNDITLTVVP
jgi:uncharacterized repeat protein (TIGR01451 family)